MTVLKNRKGLALIEYGLIAALISVVAVATIRTVGTRINATFTNVANALQ